MLNSLNKNKTELTALLKWHGIKGKAMPSNNIGKKAMWQVILDSKEEPPAFEDWTEVDEAKLEKLKSIDINMDDTAIGRAKALTQRSMSNQFDNMSKEARLAYLKHLQDNHDKIEAQQSGASSES